MAAHLEIKLGICKTDNFEIGFQKYNLILIKYDGYHLISFNSAYFLTHYCVIYQIAHVKESLSW